MCFLDMYTKCYNPFFLSNRYKKFNELLKFVEKTTDEDLKKVKKRIEQLETNLEGAMKEA